LAVASRRGGKHEHAETTTKLVQGNGDVVILVGVDSQRNEDLRRLGCGHPATPCVVVMGTPGEDGGHYCEEATARLL
jgi:hypothetical protein